MNKAWCLVSRNAFDPQRGHQCVHSQSIPKSSHCNNVHLPSKEQKIDCESQLTFSVRDKQSRYPTSVINDFENVKLHVSAQTNIKDFQTNSDFQLYQTSQFASEKMTQKFMVCNSVQTSIQESAKRETDVQAKSLNHPLSITGYDLPLDLSIRKSPIIVDNCRTSNIKTKFRNIGESLMNNSENNNLEFTMASTDIDSLVINTTGSEYLSNRQQQRSNVKMDQLLSKKCQDRNEERNLNTEFKSKIIVRNNEMVPKETRRSEMAHQFSVYRHIVHNSVQENDLENSSDHASIKVKSTDQQLKSSNMSTQKVTTDCTITQSLNSHENEITFSNQIYQVDQKQIAPAEISNTETKESKQSCFAEAVGAAIGPSSSLGNESTLSDCHKEFSSIHYMEKHYLKHSRERPFSCNICERKFIQKRDLKRHVSLIHVEGKLQCNICGNAFAKQNAFDAHIRKHKKAIHNKCDICGKIFTRKYNLREHFRLHTGEKPYKCDVCRRAFTCRSNLLDHVKRCHSIT